MFSRDQYQYWYGCTLHLHGNVIHQEIQRIIIEELIESISFTSLMVPCGLVVLSGLGGDPAKNYKKERTGDKKEENERRSDQQQICVHGQRDQSGREKQEERERERLRGHFLINVRKGRWMGKEETDEKQGQEVKTSCHVLQTDGSLRGGGEMKRGVFSPPLSVSPSLALSLCDPLCLSLWV